MKFSEHLSAHITPEWRKQYILYDELKDMVTDFFNTSYTVKLGYNELGYNEHSVITNKNIYLVG